VCLIGSVYWILVYVAVNVGSVSYRVSVLDISVCGSKCRECLIGLVYWILVYVAVNVGSVSYRVCVLEISVCGCKCRQCVLKILCTGNWFMWL